jgi:hypothetical protein
VLQRRMQKDCTQRHEEGRQMEKALSQDNIKMDLRETFYEDQRSMDLTENRVQWQPLELAALNTRFLLPEN